MSSLFLKTKYCMRFDSLNHAIGKTICVVKNQDAKTLLNVKTLCYGNSSIIAIGAICTAYGGVMGYPNLEGCSKQKWIENAKSFKNPTDDSQLALLGVGVSICLYLMS